MVISLHLMITLTAKKKKGEIMKRQAGKQRKTFNLYVIIGVSIIHAIFFFFFLFSWRVFRFEVLQLSDESAQMQTEGKEKKGKDVLRLCIQYFFFIALYLKPNLNLNFYSWISSRYLRPRNATQSKSYFYHIYVRTCRSSAAVFLTMEFCFFHLKKNLNLI